MRLPASALIHRRSLRPGVAPAFVLREGREAGLRVERCDWSGQMTLSLSTVWLCAAVMTRMRTLAVLAAITLAVVMAGCSSGVTPDSRMMGGARTGTGMMGGHSGYHYVHATCSAPSMPGHTVRVTLADMGMTAPMRGVAPMGARMMLRATPTSVAAGTVSFVASNRGWRTHELVILPLAAGASAGQRIPGSDGRVDETGSLGEASSSCAAGTGEGIASGAAGWTTVTLEAGRYELVCNLRNHYANGMFDEITVR